MEIQLNELIGKIKRDGIDSAQAEANELKKRAENEAREIVEQAKREAASIVENAKADALKSEKSGLAALEQASRNLILSFKGEIQALLDRIVVKTVEESYSIDVIKTVLPTLIASWSEKQADSLTVLLSEGDLTKLDDAFRGLLASNLKAGVDIKPARNLDAGFHIVEKDGSAFYDFSATSVATLISAYLNPKLAEIIKRVEV